MEGLKKVIGVVHIAIAAIVAIHTVIEPIYHTSTDANLYSSIWGYINPLSAISNSPRGNIQLHSHEKSQRELQCSRVYRSEHVILRFHVCRYNFLLELVHFAQR